MLRAYDKADLVDLLKEYKESEGFDVLVCNGNWTLTEGAYSKWWELYYGENTVPVAECVAGTVVFPAKDCEPETSTLFSEVKDIILAELSYLKGE